jgi:hypothetical protein
MRLCRRRSNDSHRSARAAATTGAALGARLGVGPVSTGVGAGFGAATGYLLGNAVDEAGRAMPDGGRERDRDGDAGVSIAVHETD